MAGRGLPTILKSANSLFRPLRFSEVVRTLSSINVSDYRSNARLMCTETETFFSTNYHVANFNEKCRMNSELLKISEEVIKHFSLHDSTDYSVADFNRMCRLISELRKTSEELCCVVGDLEMVNNEVVQLSQSLLILDVVDNFEYRKYLVAPRNLRGRGRSEFYQWAFSSDKDFRREMEKLFGPGSKEKVGTLAENLYAKLTKKSSTFACEVVIYRSQFRKDELHLLEAICAYLPVSVRIIDTVPADNSFLAQMKSKNRQVLILFGSETGAAEDFANRLALDLRQYGQKPLVKDPEVIDVEDLPKITEIENALLVLCVATYGEGDPTVNAQYLVDFISNNDIDFTGLRFAVFGLGNKNYEHFNEVGKVLDKRLEELGAKRVLELGLGDDANLEEDFMRWREAFLPSLAETFGWQLIDQYGPPNMERILKEPPDNLDEILKRELRYNSKKLCSLLDNQEIINNGVLPLSQSLLALGIVELFEFNMYLAAPLSLRVRGRSELYQWAFNSNQRFRQEVEKLLGPINKKTVGTLGVDLYGSLTSNIHKNRI